MSDQVTPQAAEVEANTLPPSTSLVPEGTGTIEMVPQTEDFGSIEGMQAALMNDYQLLVPVFDQEVDNMSNNQLRRLIKALVKVPLVMQEYKPPTQRELNVFNRGRRMIEVNVILTLSTISEAINKLNAAQADSETKGEEVNG